VYLLIANNFDSVCESVSAALQGRGLQTRIVANPFAAPPHFTWRLNDNENTSRLRWNDEPPLEDDEIEGVLVRGGIGVETEGWQPDDLAYMQAETQAAMLGWLWSLRCPVINRYPASVWYRPVTPLLTWQSLLWRCGLKTPEMLVSNVPGEARAFGTQLQDEVVYAPLTSNARYLISTDEDWRGLEAMQSCAPVCVAQPHGATYLVCVVGERVIWNGAAPKNAMAFEPGLRRFAAEAGLSFLQLAMAGTPDDLRVVQVEPFPRVEQFSEAARQEIVSNLTHLLIAGGATGNGPRMTRGANLRREKS
jgi:hypothetical protein